MGQFTTRPEEPTEWAGLPSEPIETRPVAESLAAPVESADSLSFLSAAVESVVIPLPSTAEVAPTGTDAAEDDPPAADER
jgi:hypothetical protein